MKVNCPSCNAEHDCGPGKHRCSCGVEFLVGQDGSTIITSTIPPRRMQADRGPETNDLTMAPESC